MARLTESELELALPNLTGWTREGDEISSEFKFADFCHALAFVVHVGTLAERADHHPDIDIRWNRVKLVLSTHSEGGLTQKDVELAGAINRVALR